MSDAICPRCEGDNLTDLPVCPPCAAVVHFPHRLCFCASCAAAHEQAEQVAEPELWLNEHEPDMEAIGRYADASHDTCMGMGVVRDADEWAFCSCTKAALLAAAGE